tara:strand:+ start:568 stop:846 length:279 start_codon:yes stop_codon:yes gene_type:complete
MKNLISFFIVVLCSGIVGCASIGGAWDAGTEIVTGTVDAVVSGTATMARAVTDDVINIATVASDITTGAIDTVADQVDKQTDELQKDPAEKK